MFSKIARFLSFVQNHLKAMIFVLIVFLLISAPKEPQPNLYRIDLYGEIFTADKFLEAIDEAKADHIKGVLLVVDSPGGAVAPSVEMMMAIRDLQKEKPVVAYAQGVMASGSYYASIWADEIVANPGGIIGSIGVMVQGVNAEKLLNTIGLEFFTAKAGDYKEIGAFYRKMTEAERKELDSLIADIYSMFVGDVAEARSLEVKDAAKFANGRVFTPRQAAEAGLIDRVGSLDNAARLVEEKAKVKSPIWNQKSKAQKFIEMLREQSRLLILDLLEPKLKAKIELD
ncbi:MAG: signal peptide peptidase SppA [Helicobacteraceae bacterium]|jgi:protease-4|nr:signal peptide peptidase SppA [Helicobacteraceae bacterium]